MFVSFGFKSTITKLYFKPFYLLTFLSYKQVRQKSLVNPDDDDDVGEGCCLRRLCLKGDSLGRVSLSGSNASLSDDRQLM